MFTLYICIVTILLHAEMCNIWLILDHQQLYPVFWNIYMNMSTTLHSTPAHSGWPLNKRLYTTLVEVSQYTFCCVLIMSGLYLFSTLEFWQCNTDVKRLCICCMLNKPLSESIWNKYCDPLVNIEIHSRSSTMVSYTLLALNNRWDIFSLRSTRWFQHHLAYF